MIKTLGSYDATESTTISELKALADQMETYRPTKTIALQKIDGNLLKKEYIDELMAHAQQGILESIKKNNEKIAIKTIKVYQ